MAPALKAALPRAGISSTISSIVRHAPTESLGLYGHGYTTNFLPSLVPLLAEISDRHSPAGFNRKSTFGNGLVWIYLGQLSVPDVLQILLKSCMVVPCL